MGETVQKEGWKETWASPYGRRQIMIGTSIMLAIVYILPFFFNYIEKRNGAILNDWVLAHVPPHNVSGFIFAIIWGMIVLTIVRAINRPPIYINYCWTLIFVSLARLSCIAIFSLDPPRGLIPLTDPLTGVFYGEALITKDLFFSGHTATLVLIALSLEKRSDKIIGILATIAVACLLVVQHIHYTIDILAAPIFTYLCFRLTTHFLWLKQGKETIGTAK
jgi:hypothetical protein